MSKSIKILLAIVFCGVKSASIADTVVGDQFYGVWSTAISTLPPKRQILNLSKDGGSWVQIDDEGHEKKFELSKEDISIENDLMTVYYRNNEKNYALKLILGGWSFGENKSIFGTVFMYKAEGNGLQLFNGMPISFDSGASRMPPQVFWSFFESDKVKHATASAIQQLEESLKKVDGIQIFEDEKTTLYSLERINSVITITQEGHYAYPSAVGLQESQRYPGTILTAAQYACDKKEFAKFYSDYNAELHRDRQEAEEYIEKLTKRKEVAN